jgi:hypothetical protein
MIAIGERADTEVFAKDGALAFSAAQAAGIPHDRSIADRDDVLLHAFIYARHIVLAARGDQSLARARAGRARPAPAVQRGARGGEPGRGAPRGLADDRAHRSMAISPARVDVPKVEHTFDTAENRFVPEFIKPVRALIDRTERLARSKAKPRCCGTPR